MLVCLVVIVAWHSLLVRVLVPWNGSVIGVNRGWCERSIVRWSVDVLAYATGQTALVVVDVVVVAAAVVVVVVVFVAVAVAPSPVSFFRSQ